MARGAAPSRTMRAGTARRILKPGHAFSRIHRDDIAQAVVAAALAPPPPGVRVLHLVDDEPCPQAEFLAEAARLMGLPPPPTVAYAEVAATLSPMARSFWEENRRVSSAATCAALGIRWRYPSWREGWPPPGPRSRRRHATAPPAADPTERDRQGGRGGDPRP